jgi:hypothetical protein
VGKEGCGRVRKVIEQKVKDKDWRSLELVLGRWWGLGKGQSRDKCAGIDRVPCICMVLRVVPCSLTFRVSVGGAANPVPQRALLGVYCEPSLFDCAFSSAGNQSSTYHVHVRNAAQLQRVSLWIERLSVSSHCCRAEDLQ